jgi:hypothetical protein
MILNPVLSRVFAYRTVSSLIRRYAADFGFRTLIQLLHGPDLYDAVSRFETPELAGGLEHFATIAPRTGCYPIKLRGD